MLPPLYCQVLTAQVIMHLWLYLAFLHRHVLISLSAVVVHLQVFTVKMAEEDFEALEDNQVLVQGMMANRYMNTFRDDILGWNKKLMNVADVNQLMSEIQRTWAYLESLFIHSEEVSMPALHRQHSHLLPCCEAAYAALASGHPAV
jgi:hypothetical protein